MADNIISTPTAGDANGPADNRDSGIRTVGQLREALDGVADDTPLIVNAADPQDADFADEQVITSAGFGSVDWGDGCGLQRDIVFGLNCRRGMADELDGMRRCPDRSPGRGEAPRDSGAGGELSWPPRPTAMARILEVLREAGSLPLSTLAGKLADSEGYSTSLVAQAVSALRYARTVSVEGTGAGAMVSLMPARVDEASRSEAGRRERRRWSGIIAGSGRKVRR